MSTKKSSELIIPNFEEFGEYLYDRIYVMLKHLELIKKDFTFFLVLRNRNDKTQFLNKKYVFAGLKKQRELLKATNDGLDKEWNEMVTAASDFKHFTNTKRIVDRFKQKKLNVSDLLKITPMKEKYFSGKYEDWSRIKKLEHKIISTHYKQFDEAYYVSLPVFQFGSLEGVAHFVLIPLKYKGLPEKIVQNRRKEELLRITRLLAREYENLIWIWDFEEADVRDVFETRQMSMLSDGIELVSNETTPLIKKLDFQSYYEESKAYFRERINQNRRFLERYLKEHRRRAITAILVDSYAHNISAHSLTTLKWWFQQRSTFSDEKNLCKNFITRFGKDKIDEIISPVVSFLEKELPNLEERMRLRKASIFILARWMKELEHQQKKLPKLSPVVTQLHPMSKQLTPLFKFLLEKGAFWSGVIRDQQFSGFIKDMYDILWNEFAKNPLYLGTIANSEGISKVHLNVRIYEYDTVEIRDEERSLHPFKRSYKIKRTENGELLNGTLATIDVSGQSSWTGSRHQYYVQGAEHDKLQTELEKCKVYFPGGVVGKHAFFTLVENEIRNVKHFSKAKQEEMKVKGLNLNISIRPAALSKKIKNASDDRVLYKIGVWLDHKTNLISHDDHLVVNRMEALRGDIITNSYRAKLGGTFQDKICAAMLFNNSFGDVQQRDTDKQDAYYPWMRFAHSYGLSDDLETEETVEVQLSNLETAEQYLIEQTDNNIGYFKKLFHVWQGAFSKKISDEVDLESENIARFKILLVNDQEKHNYAKKEGLIRIVNLNGDENHLDKEHKIYCKWLNNWVGQKAFKLTFIEKNSTIGYFIKDDLEVNYFNKKQYANLSIEEKEDYADLPEHSIVFAHGNRSNNLAKDLLLIRSHGHLSEYFFNGITDLEQMENLELKDKNITCEFLETYFTKICIMDRRVSERITEPKSKALANQLNCWIYDEEEALWDEVKRT
ncbi:MAG: hypothetical protein AAFO07_28305, partial [Bacteroidota bacterium]